MDRLWTFVIALFVFYGFSGSLPAQELVVNGGLEHFAKCPDGPVTKRLRVDGQVKAAQGNPDLYSACSSTFGVPLNWSDHQEAWEGEAYAGLVLTTDMPDECGSREYLQFPLAAPLENGRRYRLTFHVSPAANSGYFTDRVGALFSRDDHSRKGLTGHLRERAFVENPLGRFINDSTGWLTVSGVYNAMGGERFVIIGNFHPCNSSSRIRVDADKLRSAKRKAGHRMDPVPLRASWQEWMARTAYAFLDGVSLVADSTSPAIIVPLTAEQACTPLPPAIGPELIPDPSFDQNEHPRPWSWRNASDGTPDLFNGRIGLYLFSAAYTNNREYIRTPLADTLDPCTTYGFSMEVQRDGGYGYAVDAIGVAVTDTFSTRRDRLQLDLPWAWRSPVGALLLDPQRPMKLCGSFRPTGCATQLLLGNFDPDSACTVVDVGHGTDGPFAYCFVDNVHLYAIAREPGCTDPCSAPALVQLPADPGTPVADWPDVITLRFNSDSDWPLEVEEAALDQLAKRLGAEGDLRIRITGHADNSGSPEHNQRLAQDRADRLRALLVERGAAAERIETLSMGSMDPVAPNDSPEGKAQNRRVVVESIR